MTRHDTPDQVDALLTRHLSSTLDGQRGRAAAAFRAHLYSQIPAAPIPIANGAKGFIPKRALWYWAGVPSLLAACLAVAITLQFVSRPGQVKPVDHLTIQPTQTAGNLVFENLDQYELSRDLNNGITVLADDTPVRVISRQSMRHTQWTDPRDKATYSVTEQPVEKVGYVRVQPY